MNEFILLRTLANEGLKKSIFGLGSGSGTANSGNSDGGSPTCTVGTRTTRINSCGCSMSRESIDPKNVKFSRLMRNKSLLSVRLVLDVYVQ